MDIMVSFIMNFYYELSCYGSTDRCDDCIIILIIIVILFETVFGTNCLNCFGFTVVFFLFSIVYLSFLALFPCFFLVLSWLFGRFMGWFQCWRQRRSRYANEMDNTYLWRFFCAHQRHRATRAVRWSCALLFERTSVTLEMKMKNENIGQYIVVRLYY